MRPEAAAAMERRHPPPFEIRVRPPRFWSPLMLVFVAGVLGGLLTGLLLSSRDGTPPPIVAAVMSAAALALVGIVCLVRRRTLPRGPRAIRIDAGRIVLPRGADSGRYAELDAREVRSIGLFGNDKYGRLVIATPRRSFVYPLAALEGGIEAVRELRSRVRAAIALEPGGAALLGRMDRREALARSALAIRPRATYSLLALIGAAFLWEHAAGALERPLGLVALGANVPALVAEGEWFRLFAANFLHANLLHLYFNGLALLVLGALLERLIGPWRLLLIFLCGALGGSLLSTLAAPAVLSVGASTAAFGLLGALAWVNWRHRERLPTGFFQPVKWWVFIIGLNALLPVLVPQIDFAAHIGGFAAGAAAAMLLVPSAGAIRPGAAAPPSVRLAALGLAAVFAWGQAEAVRYSLRPAETIEAELARALVRDEDAPASLLNGLAWDYVTAPDTSRRALQVAHEAARRAVEAEPANGAYLDTLATAEYRLGRLDAAVATERRAARYYDDPFVFSQLARFLAARVRERGPIELGGARAGDVVVAAAPGGEAVRVELGAAFPRGVVVYALAVRGGRIVGLFEAIAGARGEPARFEWRPRDGSAIAEGGGRVRLEVALVDASDCDCAPGSFRGRFVPMQPRAAELP